MKAKCPQCHRDINTFIPKRGDGSVRYFRRHVCYSIEAIQHVNAHWDCVRVGAEVPGFHMRGVGRCLGEERPR